MSYGLSSTTFFETSSIDATRDIETRLNDMTATPIKADEIRQGERSSSVMDQPWMPSEGGIATYHTSVPPPLPTAPSFHLHLTRLRDTLFIWVGTGSEGSGEDVGEEMGSVGEKRLAADWAVAMPTRGVSTLHQDYLTSQADGDQNIPATATPLYTSGASGSSLAMSQRLGTSSQNT